MTDMHLLLVDEIDDSTRFMEAILKRHNISYTLAESAGQALRALDTVSPKMVLVNLALPVISGWQLLSRLRSKPETAKLPVVALSPFHMARIAEDAIDAGFDGYFPKPLEATSFVQELQRIAAN